MIDLQKFPCSNYWRLPMQENVANTNKTRPFHSILSQWRTYLALANFEFGSCGSFGCVVPVLYIAHYSCLVNGACVQRDYSSLQQSIWVCVHWWTNIDLSMINIGLLMTDIDFINNEFLGKHLVIFTITSTSIYE